MDSLEHRKWVGQHFEIGKEILYLSSADCQSVPITKKEVFDRTERALMLYSQKKTDMPAKIGVHPYPDTFYHAMPAGIEEEHAVGIKWCSCYPDNREKVGIPQASGIIIYNDYESGWPVCIMDCLYVTELRTPCVALVSAKYMARKNSKVFGMMGCGLQGRAHIKFVCEIFPNIEQIYIYDVFEPAMDALIKDFQATTPAKIIKARSYEELVKSSDIICSATKITSVPQPQIKDEWISKGQTIIMSDCHTLYEDATVKRADKYLLDSREQHELLLHYGYYPQGLPPIYAEIGEVIAGQKKGRERDDELIVCNNVGIMATDMMLIPIMFDRALEHKIGKILPL